MFHPILDASALGSIAFGLGYRPWSSPLPVVGRNSLPTTVEIPFARSVVASPKRHFRR